MNLNRNGVFWRCIVLTFCMACSNGYAADTGAAQKAVEPSMSRVPTSGVEVQRDKALQLELASTAARLASLEATIGKTSDRADEVARRTSRTTLYTVLGTALLTGFISLFAQWMLMRHQRRINRADSEAKIANTYVEWQLQQLSELYGPVRALLGQSNVLYRQMNRALVSADKNRFQLVDGDDFDRLEFQIYTGGAWVRFRTVQHFSEVYNRNYGVEPYFDDVIDVGERLANVIRDKAGFVRQEDGELVQVMGEYLAHFFVLKRLHGRVKTGESLHLNEADKNAVFPNRIQRMVCDGFDSINKQVMAWRGVKISNQ